MNEETTQTEDTEEPEEEQIEINIHVLESLYNDMSSAALAVDGLEPDERHPGDEHQRQK